MKISQLFGKRAEGGAGRSGYVISVNTSGGKITGLTCADEDEQEFYIPVKNIKSIKNTVCFTHGGERAADEGNFNLGKPVFDSEGNYIGRLTDITAEKNVITLMHVGNKKFSSNDVICGDAVIIKNTVRFLKSDVKKNGKIIFRRGTPVTGEVAEKARLAGEYVQTSLKTIR